MKSKQNEPYLHTSLEEGQNLDLFVGESYKPFFASKARDLLSYGGAGAAKSFSAAQKLIIKCATYPNMKELVVRKYGPSLRLTCYNLIKDLLRQYQIAHEPRDAVMNIFFPNTNSQIIFLPVAETSGEAAGRIKSMTDLTGIWFEEPTELTFEEFKTIRIRLRGQELKEGYRQRTYTFNPIDKNHWLHKFFFEPDEKGKLRQSERLKYTYKDNPFLDADYIEELEDLKNIDPIYYSVYALGEWGTLSNQIYSNYVVEEFSHPMNFYDTVCSGADFGFVHPSAWLLIGIKDADVYVIDEICERKLINSEFINRIQGKLSLYRKQDVDIYCDWAEPARIEEMSRSGLHVLEANKNVVEGINVVKRYRIHCHERCVNFNKEISGYRFKQDIKGNVTEKPVKYNDDLVDCLRYSLASGAGNTGDYSTPYKFQQRCVPVFTDISSVIGTRAAPPKWR